MLLANPNLQHFSPLLAAPSRLEYSTDADVQKKIGEMVKESDVVVFMKGIPEQPRYNRQRFET